MKTTTPATGVHHRLIQQVISQPRRSGSAISRGFTLIELLVVIVIIAILATIALPSFLGQADKAKASGAKALLASIAKECQIALVEGTQASFTPKTVDTDEINLEGVTCSGTFTAAITGGKTFEITVDAEGITSPITEKTN